MPREPPPELQPGEDVEPIQCSGRELAKELEAVRTQLAEPKDWTVRLKALRRLQGLLLGQPKGASAAKELHHAPLHHALLSQAQDLRSALVREACIAVQLMASLLGEACESLAVPALGVLLRSTSVTILIIAESCYLCACSIVRECRTARVLQALLEQLKAKSGQQRSRGFGVLQLALASFALPILERQADALQGAIREGMEDARDDVRALARRCFWAFAQKFEERGRRFLARLSAQKQRQLRADQPELETGSTTCPSPCPSTGTGSERSRERERALSQPRQAHERPAPRLRSASAKSLKSAPAPAASATPASPASPASASAGLAPAAASAAARRLKQEPAPTPAQVRSPSPVRERMSPLPEAEDPPEADDFSDFWACLRATKPAPAFALKRSLASRPEHLQETLSLLGSVLAGDRVSEDGSELVPEEALRVQALSLLEALASSPLRPQMVGSMGVLLRDLLRGSGWSSSTPLARGRVRTTLKVLQGMDGAAFRAAAGDLHPAQFQVLSAMLPEMQPKAKASGAMQDLAAQALCDWEKQGSRVLFVVLNALTPEALEETRTAAMACLQDLLQHPGCADFAEVLASKLFDCLRSDRKVLRLLERLLANIEPLRSLEILLPVVAEMEPAAILLSQCLQRLTPRQAMQHLDLILPSVANACASENAETRKAAIFCLVDLYLSVGEEAMECFHRELSPSQLTLVTMYAQRRQCGSCASQESCREDLRIATC
ncbi:unnamed protein product [Effrenium voratum]|uniref:TOG domain-containing protein n=1 Tax=Effrenium voratum TaxID=2562239 RepID=A0AA36MY95_9DINO|nr:unnamed protein product [Effrenium voratum]